MLQLAMLWLLVRVGGRLPAGVLERIVQACATLAWYASLRLRRTTRGHMRHVLGPHASPRAIDRAALGCVRTAALRYASFARAPYTAPGAEWAQVARTEGIEHLHAALADGRGVIAVSAHLGDPEFMLRAVGTLGIPSLVIAERLQPPRVDAFVRNIREAPGVRLVKADAAGARACIEHLRAGGLVLSLVDRDVTGGGRPVTFFGERALMPAGHVELALRTGAAIVPAFVTRNPGGLLDVRIEAPLALPRTGDHAIDLDRGLHLVAAALETGIARAPGQWFPLSPIWSGLAHYPHTRCRSAVR